MTATVACLSLVCHHEILRKRQVRNEAGGFSLISLAKLLVTKIAGHLANVDPEMSPVKCLALCLCS